MAARTESDISSTTSSPGHRFDPVNQESWVEGDGHLLPGVVGVNVIFHVAGVVALRTNLKVSVLHREANGRGGVLREKFRALRVR